MIGIIREELGAVLASTAPLWSVCVAQLEAPQDCKGGNFGESRRKGVGGIGGEFEDGCFEVFVLCLKL